jgi:hypothetical protein
MEQEKVQHKRKAIWDLLSDLWIVSGRMVTAVSLLILPTTIILSHYILAEIVSPFLTIDIYGHYHSKITYLPALVQTLYYFQIIAFFVILMMYPPYPAPYPVKQYFIKRGFSRAVKEFELVKKILYIAIPLLILFTSIGIIHDLELADQNKKLVKEDASLRYLFYLISLIIHPHYSTFIYTTYLLLLIVVAGIFKIVAALMRGDFRLYFAKGCFILMQDARNEAHEMRYFVMGLNSYNLYLRRLIKLQIGDLKKAYSKIASASPDQKNQIMSKFSLVFLSDKGIEDNTLQPLRSISKLLERPASEILTEQPLLNKIKDWGAAATVMVSLTISIINVLLTRH